MLIVVFGFLLRGLLLLSVLEYMELRGVRYDIDIVCLGTGWWLGLIDYEWRLTCVCMRASDVLKRINLGAEEQWRIRVHVLKVV